MTLNLWFNAKLIVLKKHLLTIYRFDHYWGYVIYVELLCVHCLVVADKLHMISVAVCKVYWSYIMQEHLAVNNDVVWASRNEMNAFRPYKLGQIHAGCFFNLHLHPPQYCRHLSNLVSLTSGPIRQNTTSMQKHWGF